MRMGLLQQILGVSQAMLEPSYARLDDLLSTEKVLVQNATVTSEAASRSLVQLLCSRKITGLRLEDVLVLLTLLCSMLGDKALGSVGDRRTLKAEIVTAIYQAASEKELPSFLEDLVAGGDGSLEEKDVIQAVDSMLSVLQRLRLVGEQANRSVLDDVDPMQPAVYKPLLRQILQEVFDPSATEVPHLEYHSGGLTDMLKAGFGWVSSPS